MLISRWLLVWLHGMDHGFINPEDLETMQCRRTVDLQGSTKKRGEFCWEQDDRLYVKYIRCGVFECFCMFLCLCVYV